MNLPQHDIIVCMGGRTLAHLVRYDGDDLAPSVTFKVGSGKGAVNRPDDVVLVSTLLNWTYNGSKRGLPRGATRLVVPGPKFTPEMKLFLTDAQSLYYSPSKADGIASPLPVQSTEAALVRYIVFELFQAIVSDRSSAGTVIDALTTVPHLLHLRSFILGPPDAGSETVEGGNPGSESFPGSGPTTN